MMRHGFTRVVRAIAATPSELYGECRAKSIDVGPVEETLSPTIDRYRGRPHDPQRWQEYAFTYLLTEQDFQSSNWLQLAQRINSWISVIFGKTVTRHQLLQINNAVLSPATIPKEKIWNRELPFYSDIARTEHPFSMDLSSLQLLEDIVFNVSAPAMQLHSAAEFYATALRQWVNEPEHAYVNMVTAGECLSGLMKYDWNELADSNALEVDAALRSCPDAERLVRLYRHQSRFIGEQFVRTLLIELPDSVCADVEYATDTCCRFTRETLRSALKNAYALRSKFVHTGSTFGVYTSIVAARAKAELWHDFEKCAIPLGHSEAVAAVSSNMLKTVRKAATFIGLERIVRRAVIYYLESHLRQFKEDSSERFRGLLPLASNPIGGRWVKVHPDQTKKGERGGRS